MEEVNRLVHLTSVIPGAAEGGARGSTTFALASKDVDARARLRRPGHDV